ALAQAGYGVAVVPSNARIPGGVRAVPILLHGESVGMWAGISWDPRRFLAPYAEQFVEELVAYSRRAYPRPSSLGARRRYRDRRNRPVCPSDGPHGARARGTRPCACPARARPGRPRPRAIRRRRPARDAARRTVRRG